MRIPRILLCLLLSVACLAQTETKKDEKPAAPVTKMHIERGARIYVAPMNGFETFVVAALIKKQVPVTIVNSRDKADYEITGASETQKANWAKMLVFGSQQSHEEASVVVSNIKTETVVYGYNVNKSNSYKGRQSSSEAIAKHIKSNIEGTGE
jgi:hypothetical protein